MQFPSKPGAELRAPVSIASLVGVPPLWIEPLIPTGATEGATHTESRRGEAGRNAAVKHQNWAWAFKILRDILRSQNSCRKCCSGDAKRKKGRVVFAKRFRGRFFVKIGLMELGAQVISLDHRCLRQVWVFQFKRSLWKI